MNVFVVEALRWGDEESHHYVVGVFTDKVLAKEVAQAEEYWRGGKYECAIREIEMNNFSEEVFEYGRACKEANK